MSDHTRPLSAFDGMMHIPLIIRHPGRIAAGTTSNLMVSGYDVMPTLLGYLGLREKIAEKPKSPGRDFSPALLGKAPAWEDVIFFDNENVRAIRTPDWKYIHRYPTALLSSMTWRTTRARRSTSMASRVGSPSATRCASGSTPSFAPTPSRSTTCITAGVRRHTCSPGPKLPS